MDTHARAEDHGPQPEPGRAADQPVSQNVSVIRGSTCITVKKYVEDDKMKIS